MKTNGYNTIKIHHMYNLVSEACSDNQTYLFFTTTLNTQRVTAREMQLDSASWAMFATHRDSHRLHPHIHLAIASPGRNKLFVAAIPRKKARHDWCQVPHMDSETWVFHLYVYMIFFEKNKYRKYNCLSMFAGPLALAIISWNTPAISKEQHVPRRFRTPSLPEAKLLSTSSPNWPAPPSWRPRPASGPFGCNGAPERLRKGRKIPNTFGDISIFTSYFYTYPYSKMESTISWEGNHIYILISCWQ